MINSIGSYFLKYSMFSFIVQNKIWLLIKVNERYCILNLLEGIQYMYVLCDMYCRYMWLLTQRNSKSDTMQTYVLHTKLYVRKGGGGLSIKIQYHFTLLHKPRVKYGVRSPKFIWAPCAQLYSLAETPQPPLPPHLGPYTRALLVSQDRRHLFVTPWYKHLLAMQMTP
jgi:hypothetical protein